MNTVAISLGIKTWQPSYQGKKREKIAPEMAKKTSEPKRISSGKGNYAEGQRNRAAIVTFLADGNAHKLADIAHSADLSETTARRHLLDLVNLKAVQTNIGTVVISRKHPLLFWRSK